MTTVLAILTPPGRSALATLALHGPDAWAAVRAHFQPALPETPEPGRTWLGRLGRDVADEVVLACKQAAPVPWVEIHCHGGPEVVRLLVELFAERGVAEIDWREFAMRTQPTLQALAGVALTQATTERVAKILLDQYRGALETALRRIESHLGHAEPAAALAGLRELARWSPLGRKLVSGFRVVLAGPPNVGKSSLANALAGYPRSVVAATPGTTRDVVTTRLALDGWPVELCDTAGLRGEADELERQGIDRTRATLDAADLVLWLMDVSVSPAVPSPVAGALAVVNKIDLPAAWPVPTNAVAVSATTGQGLDGLIAAVVARLVPEAPPPGTALPFMPELADAIDGLVAKLSADRHAEARAELTRILADPQQVPQ